jgi:arylsulfatase A-like enzyme
LLELVGAKEAIPAGLDGISFAPTLRGKTQPTRPFLYREFAGYGGQQSLRVGRWKAIRTKLNRDMQGKYLPGPLELYDLEKDPAETTDLANRNKDIVAKLASILREQHATSKVFPIEALDVR